MDISNQTGQIDEELQLLKTEIKQVLHNVQENVFKVQDPFGGLPAAEASQSFASLDDVQASSADEAFVSSEDGKFQGSGNLADGGFSLSSQAGPSASVAPVGGPGPASVSPAASAPVGGPGPGLAPISAEQGSSATLPESIAQSSEANTTINAAGGQLHTMSDTPSAPSQEFQAASVEPAKVNMNPVRPEQSTSEPQMAISLEESEIDPQASIDALLAQQAAATSAESTVAAGPPQPAQEPSIGLELESLGSGPEGGRNAGEAQADEYVNAGGVPTASQVERPVAPDAGSQQPAKRPQQNGFSRAALTYALSPSRGGGHGEQRSDDESMDLLTIAGLAQWAHGVLQRYGKEYLSAILEISQLTGRITKDTQEIIMSISPLLESASTEKGLAAKQIVSMLAQLDAFLGTVSDSDSRLLPFLLQDDMEVFPLIRP